MARAVLLLLCGHVWSAWRGPWLWRAEALHVSCWSEDISWESCCSPAKTVAAAACFDKTMFTARECCGAAAAVLFPEASIAKKNIAYEAAAAVHPSYTEEQQQWEKKNLLSSTVRILRSETIGGIGDVVLHDFKGGEQFATNYRDYAAKAGRHDPYGLQERRGLGEWQVALDIGANLGLIAILLAKRAHRSARVYAMEAHPVIYRYLLWNLRDNNVTSLVWPIWAGGCDAKFGPSVSLWPWWAPSKGLKDNFAALSGLQAPERISTRIRVPCLSLQSLMTFLKIRRVAFLKVDCEGCEWSFLGGDRGKFLARAVQEGRIERIVGELHEAGRFRQGIRGGIRARSRSLMLRAICEKSAQQRGGQGGSSCNAEMERCDVFYPLCQSPVRRRISALAAEIGVLRRAPTASRARRTMRLARSWRPAKPEKEHESAQASLSWAYRTAEKLNQMWWSKLRVSRSRRNVFARAGGALLARTASALCDGGALCLAQVGSRAAELLRRGAANRAADSFVSSLRPFVPWASEWQTPARYIRGLLPIPVWTKEELQTRAPDSAVSRIATALEDGFPRIMEDFARIRKRRVWPASYGPELIEDPRNWSKVLLYDGDLLGAPPPGFPGEPYKRRELHAGLCRRFAPNTCEILQDLVPGLKHPGLPYLQPDFEQVAFFHLAPGNRIEFHHASSNGRLGIHLCLTGCGGRAYLQVGPRRLHWRLGKVHVFDDSFLHMVNNPADDRWILHVFAAHPELDSPDKFRATILEQGRLWPH
eukprot:TRINITY_DN72917_c0_g1_i1.p1 TRINITY_DN72917_c0_g1~~TRINITY_DN72917_c0_g1_i1.p1  ORF type:complete len:761 (+),score=88.62 TRINITY_DN72917_c0_g1_i1:88-2370(+)